MGYLKEAAPIVGNAVLLPDRELLPHIVAEHGRYLSDRKIGALDAPEYIVAGACMQRQSGYDDYWSAQQMFSRDMLDAYEYTDRTARVTDCASEESSNTGWRHEPADPARQDRLESIREGWVSFHEGQVWNELLTVEDAGYELLEAYHVGGTPEAINTLAQFIARLKSERSLSTDDGLIAVGTLAVSIVTQAVAKEAERLADQTMECEE